MKVTLSAALSADGCLDDASSRRLMLSSPEDWEAVHRLRAESDAILVGAGTLRSDDPALVIRQAHLREERIARGENPDLLKVVVSGSAALSPSLRFFTEGAGEKILFTCREPSPEVAACTTVVRAPHIDAALLVTELEKRGVRRLLVEGGGQILRMFLRSGLADVLRLAVAPRIRVDDPAAPRLCPEGVTMEELLSGRIPRVIGLEKLGYMSVMTYDLSRYGARELAHDRALLSRAVALGHRCTPCADCYRVGAVVRTADGSTFEGYTHGSGERDHAEEAAIAAAIAAGADLCGATMYTSMEPCSQRASKPLACTQLLLHHRFARCVFALYEPARFARCTGALDLRRAGVEVRFIPEEAQGVMQANAHLL